MLGAGSLWGQYGDARQRAEGQLVAQARTMAKLVDREFERAGTVAEMLAGSTVLARGDLDAFEREMRAAALMLSADLPPGAGQVLLRLVRADGVRLLDTSWAPGERRANLRLAFEVPPASRALVGGQHVGIIDDVVTTGVTLDEIAATLKRAGASRVTCLAFARTPRR